MLSALRIARITHNYIFFVREPTANLKKKKSKSERNAEITYLVLSRLICRAVIRQMSLILDIKRLRLIRGLNFSSRKRGKRAASGERSAVPRYGAFSPNESEFLGPRRLSNAGGRNCVKLSVGAMSASSDGQINWPAPRCVFDATRTQITVLIPRCKA